MTTSEVRLDLDYVNFPTVPIIFTLGLHSKLWKLRKFLQKWNSLVFWYSWTWGLLNMWQEGHQPHHQSIHAKTMRLTVLHGHIMVSATRIQDICWNTVLTAVGFARDGSTDAFERWRRVVTVRLFVDPGKRDQTSHAKTIMTVVNIGQVLESVRSIRIIWCRIVD